MFSHPSSSSTSFTILSLSPRPPVWEAFRRCFRRLGIGEGTKNRADDSDSGLRRWRGRGAMEARVVAITSFVCFRLPVGCGLQGVAQFSSNRRKIPSQRAKRASQCGERHKMCHERQDTMSSPTSTSSRKRKADALESADDESSSPGRKLKVAATPSAHRAWPPS